MLKTGQIDNTRYHPANVFGSWRRHHQLITLVRAIVVGIVRGYVAIGSSFDIRIMADLFFGRGDEKIFISH